MWSPGAPCPRSVIPGKSDTAERALGGAGVQQGGVTEQTTGVGTRGAGRQGACAEGCKEVSGCLAVSKMEAA